LPFSAWGRPGDVVQKIDGIPTTEPAFNLPALWIPPDREEDAKFAGYTVVDNSTVMATHITEIIRSNAAELLGRQEVQQLLSNLSKTSPKAVEELVPNVMTLGLVQKVLQNLLRERVSVRNLLGIVETLADYGPMTKDTDLLTEYVRQKIARGMIAPYIQPDKVLQVITLDRSVEEMLTKNIKHTEHGSYLRSLPYQSLSAKRGDCWTRGAVLLSFARDGSSVSRVLRCRSSLCSSAV